MARPGRSTFEKELLEHPSFEMQLLMEELEFFGLGHAHGNRQCCVLEATACRQRSCTRRQRLYTYASVANNAVQQTQFALLIRRTEIETTPKAGAALDAVCLVYPVVR